MDDVRWNLWSCWDTIPFRDCADFNETLASCGLWVYEWYVTFHILSNLTLNFNRTFRDVFCCIPLKCVTQKQSEKTSTNALQQTKTTENANQIRFTRGYNPTPYPHKLHFMIYPYKYPLNRQCFFFTKPLNRLTATKSRGSRLRFFQLQGLFGVNHGESKWPSETMWNYCWWFRNPVNSPVDMVNFLMIYRVLHTSKRWFLQEFWTINGSYYSMGITFLQLGIHGNY